MYPQTMYASTVVAPPAQRPNTGSPLAYPSPVAGAAPSPYHPPYSAPLAYAAAAAAHPVAVQQSPPTPVHAAAPAHSGAGHPGPTAAAFAHGPTLHVLLPSSCAASRC